MTEEELKKEELKKYAPVLLKLIPEDGTPVGNITLLRELRREVKQGFSYDILDTDYWEIRNSLIDRGIISKGRGQGGSVYREQVTRAPSEAPGGKKVKEADLYPLLSSYIEKTWVKDNAITNFVLEKTASGGRRHTGGRWTRPDFALVAVRTYPYLPGRILELITFEVKPANEYGIEGVFEAAAHSVFAHRSYLAIHLPDGEPGTDEFARVEQECERFGIGLIIFKNPDDWTTYETLVEAERKNPDPGDVNGFIASQIKKENQGKVLEIVH